jgi:hypothetical protein
MSQNLSAAYIAQFDAEVKQAYQATSQLRGTVRTRTGVIGSTHRFPKMSKGAATPHVPQSDVTPLGIAHSHATATLTDWDAPEYTDIFMQQKVNFDERRELVQVVSAAIGRRYDQIIIDAMIAASAPNTVSNDVGGTDTNLNVSKLREAARKLTAKNVPMQGRYIAIHANNLEGLLGETQVTSADFNTVKALVQGEINTFMGFRFIVLGDRDEGGLPLASNDRTCLAWHMSAVGLAEGIAPRTAIDWIPQKVSYLVNASFSAGAVAIDDDGIVKITCREA